MISIHESKRPITEDDLTRIENTINGPLPKEYRAFLLAHNGGRPEPDTIDIDEWPWQSTDVSVLYAIDHPDESCDILEQLESLEGCKANKLLPIAGDSGANNFALVIAEEGYGEVLYFDAAEIPPRPYFVAPDFDSFLAKIRDLTPEERAEIDAIASDESADETD